MRAIVVAGGTGGHIYPALAIISKIKEKEHNSEFLYIGTTDRMEKDIIPEKGIPFIGLEMKGLNRKNIFSNVSVLKNFIAAVKRTKKIIDEFKPDIVIGAGGYITAPVLYAAHKKGIPTLIHEQGYSCKQKKKQYRLEILEVRKLLKFRLKRKLQWAFLRIKS